MPLFKVFTSIKLEGDDRDTLTNKATAQIAEIIKKDVKYVTLTFSGKVTKISDTDDEDENRSECYIIYFDRYNKELKKTLTRAGKVIGSLLLNCPQHKLNKHNFILKFLSYKNRKLVDWTKKSKVIASTPVLSQGFRETCWAHTASGVTSNNYSIDNPSITDHDEIQSSPQDLTDWVYSFNHLKRREVEIQYNGTYGGIPSDAYTYIKYKGISLLRNYEMAPDDEKRHIVTTFDDRMFNTMARNRGERIFIKEFNHITRDNKHKYSLELMTQLLHKGTVHATMIYCKGCDKNCRGFDSFDGRGVYDEKPHPPGHDYAIHGVVVVGAGNKYSKDYLKIRNSRGPKWAKKGYAKAHLKFFTRIYQVLGTEKKVWIKSGEDWVMTATT